MIKVLNIVTGGLIADGITSTQYAYLKAIYDEKLNRRVTVDLVEIDGLSNDDVSSGFRIIGCKIWKLPNRKKKVIDYFIKLVSLIRKEKYDIVHVHGSSSLMSIELLAAKICGVKVRIAHSRNMQCDHDRVHKLLKPVFNKLYTDAFACGEDAGKFLFSGKEFVVIHNGKDFETFKFDEEFRVKARNILNLDGNIVFGHVGSLNRQKNHRFLLQVFSKIKEKIPNSILYLMGDGELKNELEKISERLGIKDSVVFAGKVDDVPFRLQAMDVMIFPSLFEGLPNVVLEWQAVGLPSLISDSITKECAISDLVEFMPLNSSADEWAEKAIQLAQKDYNRMIESKKATEDLKSAGFDIKKNALDLVCIYEKLSLRR